jgi:hypothetical protein
MISSLQIGNKVEERIIPKRKKTESSSKILLLPFTLGILERSNDNPECLKRI